MLTRLYSSFVVSLVENAYCLSEVMENRGLNLTSFSVELCHVYGLHLFADTHLKVSLLRQKLEDGAGSRLNLENKRGVYVATLERFRWAEFFCVRSLDPSLDFIGLVLLKYRHFPV